ncbi:hypothetical protein ABZ726_17330 [Streptomyces hundungensis]|uniref:hypothetical protein n=1 Tax=Streptomyces hundungensis TaxID=1077946 RepID=UPI0033ED88CB
MRANEQDGKVVITVDRDEVSRMTGIMAESLSLLTRSEFYIRTGCSKPNVEELVERLQGVAAGTTGAFELDLSVGVEAEENPRRPRN